MRIIAGSAKGTKLAAVPPGTRPMLDRVREGLFSSLGERVAGARVLDLYSGTGAVGIEALSRGAADARFVERSAGAIKVIEENLRRTKLEHYATVTKGSVLAFLRGRASDRADLVLLDAPYGLEPDELDQVLARLDEAWLEEEGGWTVMLSRAPRSYMPVTPISWVIERRLSYGDTFIHLYREA